MDLVLIVDQNDNPIGQMTKNEAILAGAIRRIVKVIIIDQDGKIMLQKRSNLLSSNPGKWDIAAGGHVTPNEDYLQAAIRETKEELGILIDSPKLINKEYTEVKTDKGINKAFMATFLIKLDSKILESIEINKEEVQEIKFFTSIELVEKLKNEPDIFTGGTLLALKDFLRII